MFIYVKYGVELTDESWEIISFLLSVYIYIVNICFNKCIIFFSCRVIFSIIFST